MGEQSRAEVFPSACRYIHRYMYIEMRERERERNREKEKERDRESTHSGESIVEKRPGGLPSADVYISIETERETNERERERRERERRERDRREREREKEKERQCTHSRESSAGKRAEVLPSAVARHFLVVLLPLRQPDSCHELCLCVCKLHCIHKFIWYM